MRGLTLIELLIVIAILGVLAAGIWASLNPAERIRQSEDAQRKANISTIVTAVISYSITHEGRYPWYPYPDDDRFIWLDKLVEIGELKSVPTNPNPVIIGACAGVPQPPDYLLGGFATQNSYCLVTTNQGNEAIVYVQMTSQPEKKKCPADYSGRVWFLYSSVDGKAGIVCYDEVLPGEQYEYR